MDTGFTHIDNFGKVYSCIQKTNGQTTDGLIKERVWHLLEKDY